MRGYYYSSVEPAMVPGDSSARHFIRQIRIQRNSGNSLTDYTRQTDTISRVQWINDTDKYWERVM